MIDNAPEYRILDGGGCALTRFARLPRLDTLR